MVEGRGGRGWDQERHADSLVKEWRGRGRAEGGRDEGEVAIL